MNRFYKWILGSIGGVALVCIGIGVGVEVEKRSPERKRILDDAAASRTAFNDLYADCEGRHAKLAIADVAQIRDGKIYSWTESPTYYDTVDGFSSGQFEEESGFTIWRFNLDLTYGAPFPLMAEFRLRDEVTDRYVIGLPEASIGGIFQPVCYHRPNDNKEANRRRNLIFEESTPRAKYEVLCRIKPKDNGESITSIEPSSLLTVKLFRWEPVKG